MLLLLCSTSTWGTTMVMSRLSPLNRLCLCEEWRWFSTNSENSNIFNRTFLPCSYCESMKRWSLPDKKADVVTVINFMQIFPELKLTRRELDPKLWGGMSERQQQHIIRESQCQCINKSHWILRDLTWRKASSVLKLGVFGVTIEIGTGDLNAWNRV